MLGIALLPGALTGSALNHHLRQIMLEILAIGREVMPPVFFSAKAWDRAAEPYFTSFPCASRASAGRRNFETALSSKPHLEPGGCDWMSLADRCLFSWITLC